MQTFIIILFMLGAGLSFWQFLRGKFNLSPLWLMLSVWFIAVGISQLRLSVLELSWPSYYKFLLFSSLASFVVGVLVFDKIWTKYPWWTKLKLLVNNSVSLNFLRYLIYLLFVFSLGALYLFYQRIPAYYFSL